MNLLLTVEQTPTGRHEKAIDDLIGIVQALPSASDLTPLPDFVRFHGFVSQAAIVTGSASAGHFLGCRLGSSMAARIVMQDPESRRRIEWAWWALRNSELRNEYGNCSKEFSYDERAAKDGSAESLQTKKPVEIEGEKRSTGKSFELVKGLQKTEETEVLGLSRKE